VTGFPALSAYRWSSDRASDQFPVENPATGAVITTVQGGAAPEVDGAVRAAHHAFQSDWRWRAAAERGRYLLDAADLLENHADELASIESLENGKPVADARNRDVAFLVSAFRYYGSLVDKLPTEFYDTGTAYTATVLEPLGVVAAIIPFNWPPVHLGGKLAPALAVGNAVAVKPSEQAPLVTARIVELLANVLPDDVIQLVPGLGSGSGAALAAHPLVRKVSFTGSTQTGAAVARAAADNVTSVMLELGGKNAFIVFDDADLRRAARDALDGGYYNKGEACAAASRILVQRAVHDQFVDTLAKGVSALRVGDGADPSTHVGPLVTRAQQKRVLSYLTLGEQEGAKIVAQAALPDDPALADGFYVPPTLFAGVTRAMRIANEEMFGPVVTVTAFDDEAEAVDIANSTEYGLTAGIYTRDSERAFRLARQIDVGMVFINNYQRGGLSTPFGGVKGSGYGREHVIATMREFGYTKMIRFNTGRPRPAPWRAVADALGQV
jgi:acyl-CoA reductase-like NAD-dependent aldehyde dehydrogenase